MEKPTGRVAEKAGIEENNCFKEKGDTVDEVVLKFDDSKELYVSEGFLSYASPVFKAMFTHECKEKTTREVELTGKDYADFHNFLLCLHPGVQKAVDRLPQMPPVPRLLTKGKHNKEATASIAGLFRQQAPIFGVATPSPLFCFGSAVSTGKEEAPETPLKKDNGPAECKRLFDDLPEKIKVRLILARLRLCDDGKFRDEPV